MMEAVMNGLRRELGRIAELRDETDAAERRILSSAQARMGDVDKMISEADPSDAATASLYAERVQLQGIISQAQKALGL